MIQVSKCVLALVMKYLPFNGVMNELSNGKFHGFTTREYLRCHLATAPLNLNYQWHLKKFCKMMIFPLQIIILKKLAL